MGRLRWKAISGRLRVGTAISALALGMLLLGTNAQAQQPLASGTTAAQTITSGIQIQNLSSSTANVVVDYYNADGTHNTQQPLPPIAPNSSFTVFGSTMSVPAGFTGSVVISADQPVAAITNLLASNPTMGESYDGIGSPSTSSFVPLFQQNNHGYNTTLYIQNTSAGSAANVTVVFNGGGAPVTDHFALNGGQSLAVNGQTGAGFDNISGTFVGSATVTSDQPVALEVNQTNGSILFSYDGSATGTSTIFAPLLMNNNHGFSTGFQVQNVSTTQSTTVSLFLNGGTTAAATAPLAPGQSVTWFPIPGTSAGFVGSGTVTSSPNVPLLGAVNELNTLTNQGMTYQAFGAGTQTVSMPLVMFGNAGYYTGEQVQNVGGAPATVDFSVNGTTENPGGNPVVLQPGQSYTYFSFTSDVIPGNGKVGAAQAHAREAGSQLVAIVNEITNPQSSGDTSFAYEGFNTSP